MATLLLILVPAVLFVAAVVGLLVMREREPDAPSRPWWGSPAFWLGVSIAFVVIGVFVAPRLLGFTFLFLPFVWIGGLGRRRQREARED